jgi:hypothetical protein
MQIPGIPVPLEHAVGDWHGGQREHRLRGISPHIYAAMRGKLGKVNAEPILDVPAGSLRWTSMEFGKKAEDQYAVELVFVESKGWNKGHSPEGHTFAVSDIALLFEQKE